MCATCRWFKRYGHVNSGDETPVTRQQPITTSSKQAITGHELRKRNSAQCFERHNEECVACYLAARAAFAAAVVGGRVAYPRQDGDCAQPGIVEIPDSKYLPLSKTALTGTL